MKVTIIGRGNVGGGVARLLEAAGHDVTALGSDGGDASDADVVLLAAPGDAVEDALGRVSGVEGKIVVDATNAIKGRPEGFDSLAAQVKSLTNGPVAKAFNANFAALYDQLPQAGKRPSMFYAADDEARDVTEQLVRDAGYEPVHAGDLSNAAALEDLVTGVFFPVVSGRGPFFYRVGGPEEI